MVELGVSILDKLNDDYLQITNKILTNKVNWIHYDIMDGNFVPNTSFQLRDVQKIIKNSPNHFVDIHLMVNDVEKYLDLYGPIANLIVFHHEAVNYKLGIKLLKLAKSYQNGKLKVGIAINPTTNIEQIFEYFSLIDYVLIMSVVPGRGGQSFILDTLKKITLLSNYLQKINHKILIGVDGGVKGDNLLPILKAGANVVISGSYITSDPKRRIEVINKQIKCFLK